jgi:hypothetical protein
MNALDSVDRLAHLHVGWNLPGYLPDTEPSTFTRFDDTKSYLISELLAAADSVASWNEPHECDDIPCPSYGDECPNDLANSLSLAAEDLNLANGPAWGGIVAGYSWWIKPCVEFDCVGGLIRRIASEWHGGQSSALYALASSGAIGRGAADEAAKALQEAEEADRTDLDLLVAYVAAVKERRPVPGWSLGWN